MSTGLFYHLRAKRLQKRYTQPQIYDVQITVTGLPSDGTVLLPTPLPTAYQTIIEKSSFPASDPAAEQYASQSAQYWRIPLPNAAVTNHALRLTYQIRVEPRLPSLEAYRELTMAEYALSAEQKTWLRATDHLRVLDAQIQTLMRNELAPQTLVMKTIAAAYRYVLHHLRYGNPMRGLYDSQTALTHIAVDCGGFDSLLVTLLRASGIPARLVAGYWAGYAKNGMHAWAECVLPNNEWLPLDPSVHQLRNQKRTMKSGGFGWVGSDRIAVSTDCDHAIALSTEDTQPRRTTQLDILQTPVLLQENGEITPLPYTITTRSA